MSHAKRENYKAIYTRFPHNIRVKKVERVLIFGKRITVKRVKQVMQNGK